jgi:hypothetical protein
MMMVYNEWKQDRSFGIKQKTVLQERYNEII